MEPVVVSMFFTDHKVDICCRTAMGGSTLYVEAACVETGDGKGGLRTTGEQHADSSRCLRPSL